MFFPAADTIAFSEGGLESMRIDSSGNVGIGTGSPATKLGVAGAISFTGNISAPAVDASVYRPADGTLGFVSNGSEQMRLTSAGLLQFNSGYGSVSTAYGCRAWVNFNGTTNTAGFCTIRASGGVTSVADNGTGDYTINFSFTMPDANYAIIGTTNNSVSTSGAAGFQGVMQDSTNAPTASAVRIKTIRSTVSFADLSLVSVSIFR